MNLTGSQKDFRPDQTGDQFRAECNRPDPWLSVGFAPDFLVPAQFYDLTRRRAAMNGETRLVYAVLEDAVRCYVRNAKASRGMRRQLFDEVEGWFQARAMTPSLFSFAHVCEVLEIDPNVIRRQLRNLRPEDLPTKQSRSVGRRHLVRARRRGGSHSRGSIRQAIDA